MSEFLQAVRWDARDDDLIQRMLSNRRERAYELLHTVEVWPVRLWCSQCVASAEARDKVEGATWIASHGLTEARHLSPVDTVTITVSKPSQT
jgi:hypothetical protein